MVLFFNMKYTRLKVSQQHKAVVDRLSREQVLSSLKEETQLSASCLFYVSELYRSMFNQTLPILFLKSKLLYN